MRGAVVALLLLSLPNLTQVEFVDWGRARMVELKQILGQLLHKLDRYMRCESIALCHLSTVIWSHWKTVPNRPEEDYQTLEEESENAGRIMNALAMLPLVADFRMSCVNLDELSLVGFKWPNIQKLTLESCVTSLSWFELLLQKLPGLRILYFEHLCYMDSMRELFEPVDPMDLLKVLPVHCPELEQFTLKLPRNLALRGIRESGMWTLTGTTTQV
ncbi:hypothetical protein K402DRAFT_270421 [Aulographum hederae CBS 113979]|uniref:F-box domain-containing protein n=1 Tax=Aulographum hederae CBS 113979 TaxID=1176131 RepID=A0A6G1H819_9PEZI|nr:hypothetical protein K402DRAFT_270421 [Aulographum hederae CBS 113979]